MNTTFTSNNNDRNGLVSNDDRRYVGDTFGSKVKVAIINLAILVTAIGLVLLVIQVLGM